MAMIIHKSEFIKSSSNVLQCPPADKPEFAFVGRSNVGKSSLINALTGNAKLAHTSATPGKTQTINHFIINDTWYLVDLPGYGYAKTSKTNLTAWKKMIEEYISKRENLYCLFLLIDCRLSPQKNDLEFMEQLALAEVPFVITFTKYDKLRGEAKDKNIEMYKAQLLESWEELPRIFVTSAETKIGRDEILTFIKSLVK
ncbi:MAG: ribosome biogenesis GTP-binding protein YihA/YsxC [Bacteroidales bacterium]